MPLRRSASSRLIPILTVALAVLPSCGRQQPAAGPETAVLQVFVSIPPQKYFVERIGGRYVEVHVLLSPGQSPHTYEPTAKQMVELARARIYFCVGMPFEKQLAAKIRAAAPELTVVDTSEGIRRREWDASMTGHPAHEDHDGHSHRPDEQSWDTHTWMSPRLAAVHARNICQALCRVDPAHRAFYEGNLKKLTNELDRLDRQIAEALAPLKGRSFYVFHPAFGYFADAYGLKQVAIEMSGKQPTAKYLNDLIRRAEAAGVKLIFVQPQFSRQGAEAVARAIGGAVVPLDPLAENYMDNLRSIVDALRKALGTAPASAPAARRSAPRHQEGPT